MRVEPWGEDSVRVRVGPTGLRDDVPGALLERPSPGGEAEIEITDGRARLRAGRLGAEVSDRGLLRFSRADTGDELVAEEPAHFWWPGPRLFTATGNGYHRIEQRFEAYAGERIFGLGQHQHGMGNGTRWVADSARQIDYWVTTGEGPRDILHHYADATGHAPLLPEWAAGFWQSKLR